MNSTSVPQLGHNSQASVGVLPMKRDWSRKVEIPPRAKYPMHAIIAFSFKLAPLATWGHALCVNRRFRGLEYGNPSSSSTPFYME